MFVTHLECSLTGERYEADAMHGLSAAGRPLLVRYATDAGAHVSWFSLESLGALFRRHRADDTTGRSIRAASIACTVGGTWIFDSGAASRYDPRLPCRGGPRPRGAGDRASIVS